MVNRSPLYRLAVMLLVIAMPVLAFAKASGRGNSITFDVPGGYDTATLTITGPDEESYTATFRGGQPVTFNLADLPGETVANGSYGYEIRFSVKVPASVSKQLANARAAGDDKAASKILKAAGISVPAPVSGHFLVAGSSIVDTDATEADANDARLGTPTNNATQSGGTTMAGPAGRFTPEAQDQVIPDDLIVQGSICAGLDCVNNESFGFDTIRMKENNLRIKAEDTSTSSGFPATDWQLTFNDSASGGVNKFSVDDITSALVPFTVEGGTPTNSLYVDSSGNIGLGTSSPVLDLSITTNNTPAIRLEQTNTGGFTAQTWDVAGNEANFFVRDVTGGSLLSLRIRPGAPTSSIDIAADGKVGLGTASPSERLHVPSGNVLLGSGNLTLTSGNFTMTGAAQINSGNLTMSVGNFLLWGSSWGIRQNATTNNLDFVQGSERMSMTTGGSVGIGTTSPSSRLHVNGGDIRVSGGSFIDDGVTLTAPDYVFEESYELMPLDELARFIETEKHLPNIPSAVEFKEKGINLSKLQFGLLEKVEELTLYTVDQHKQINELKTQNQQLMDRLAALEAQVAKKH